ncbi:MAG: carboxypeptidase-like regulatory domain-containing protein, partial [Pirellulales bacterium]
MSARVKMLIETRDAILPGCRKPFAVIATAASLGCLLLLTSIQLGASAEPPTAQPAADGARAQGESAQPRAANSPNRDREIDTNELETGVVAGRLTDASNGEPVPDATVILRSGGREIATSDRNGEFRFENVPEYSKGYRLWAHQENLVTGIVPVTQLAADDAAGPRFKPLQLTMTPGQQARFVVTSKGKPIAGAAVRFGYPDRRNVPTSDDGTATVQGLLPQIYDVTIEAEGYARNTPQIDLAQGGPVTELSVALVPGGVVQGVVIDEQGQRVPDAEVVYWEPNATGYHGDAFRTNDQGEFRNRFLPLNVPLEVSIDKDDYVRTKQDISLS